MSNVSIKFLFLLNLKYCLNAKDQLFNDNCMKIYHNCMYMKTYLNDTLGVDSFTGSRLSSNQHRLIFRVSQHILVSVVRNGVDMRRHLRTTFVVVALDNMVIVHRQPLKGIVSLLIYLQNKNHED